MIDNQLPRDPRYPKYRPDPTAFNPRYNKKGQSINVIVDVGDYIVDRDGLLMVATTSNRGPYHNDALRDINEGFIRARYLGNSDDGGVCANQIRRATPAEIEKANKYIPISQLELL